MESLPGKYLRIEPQSLRPHSFTSNISPPLSDPAAESSIPITRPKYVYPA